jgi:SAM-dependent methyltransferase
MPQTPARPSARSRALPTPKGPTPKGPTPKGPTPKGPTPKGPKRKAVAARAKEHSFAFDRDYYRRYYENPRTRVSDESDDAALGRFLGAYLRMMKLPVRQVLDLGCGLGRLRKVFAREFPGARYTGVERSEYLCERYGFEQGSVVDFRPRGRYDLVVCKGVMQYLSRTDATTALDNLSTLTRGCLYLEALTQEDWDDACDQRRTDGDVYLRPARFYRERLRKSFINCGGGVFLHKDAGPVLYALETL